MENQKDLVLIFTGSLVDVQYYSERLEESNIASMWKDENAVGIITGVGTMPNSVDLFVAQRNAERAVEIIRKLQNEAQK